MSCVFRGECARVRFFTAQAVLALLQAVPIPMRRRFSAALGLNITWEDPSECTADADSVAVSASAASEKAIGVSVSIAAEDSAEEQAEQVEQAHTEADSEADSEADTDSERDASDRSVRSGAVEGRSATYEAALHAEDGHDDGSTGSGGGSVAFTSTRATSVAGSKVETAQTTIEMTELGGSMTSLRAADADAEETARIPTRILSDRSFADVDTHRSSANQGPVDVVDAVDVEVDPDRPGMQPYAADSLASTVTGTITGSTGSPSVAAVVDIVASGSSPPIALQTTVASPATPAQSTSSHPPTHTSPTHLHTTHTITHIITPSPALTRICTHTNAPRFE